MSDLNFTAGIDRTQWKSDIDAIRRDLLGLNSTVQSETQKMDSSFRTLGAGIAGYFSGQALLGFAQKLINVRGEFQKTEIAFTTMLGSAEKSKVLMGQMVDLAAKTPFGLQDVTDGAKRLLAFQVPAEQVVDTLTRIGNVAAGLGVPMGQLIHVYGQVKAQGKLMTNDLYQFMNAGIPMTAELAKVMGVAENQVKDLISAGKVGFPEVQKVIANLTNEGGMFFNLMEAQSASLSGKVSNLEDNFTQMFNKIGEANEGILNDGIDGLSYLVENYEDVIQIITTLVATYGAYRAALIVTASLQKAQAFAEGTIAAIRFAQGISGMTKAQLLFNMAAQANPYVLIASGIAAVVAALVYLRTGNKEAKETTDKLTASMEYQKSVNDSVSKSYEANGAKIVSSIDREIAVLKSSYSTVEMRKKAYESLISINKSFVGTVDSEFRATNKLNEAYTALVSRLKELAIAKGKAALLEELSKKKAEADLNLVMKQDAYEKQRTENAKKRAANANKDNLGAGQYKEFRLNEGVDYSSYNPAKEAKKQRDEITKQFNMAADEVAKGAKEAANKNDKELSNAWGNIMDATDSGQSSGWAEKIKAQIEAIEAQMKSAPTEKAYRALEARKKKLEELLNPKKDKDKDLSEVFSTGSIADLERRISEWNNALQRADTEKDVVKVRKTDKYGKEKETGETVTIAEAKKQVEDLEKAKAEAEKKIRNLSFDEQLAETERQWNIRYQIAKQYGEDIAKAQFPNLGDSYFDELNKQFKPLDDQYKSGATLSDADLKKWETLKKIIDSLNGVKDPFTNFTDGLDEEMSKLSTYAEKMEFLNKQLYSPEIMSGEGIDNKHKAEIIKRQEDLKKSWQQTYQSILEEQKTYEEKSAELANQYAKAKETDQYKNGTDSDREKVDNYYSNEASKLSLEAIKSSKAWQVAFGDMEYFSKSSLDNIYKSLIEFKEKSSNTLKPTELRELEEAINRVQIASGNLGIPNVKESFEKWKTSADNAKKAQDDYNKSVYEFGANSNQAKTDLDNLISAQDNYSNATKNLLSNFSNFQGKLKSIGEIAQGVQDVFVQLGGDMDSAFGDVLNNINQTIDGLNQFSEGAMQAISGFASGNILQGIAGSIKAIGGVIKSVSGWLNGDKKKERQIKKQADQLKILETAYNDVAYAAEKAFGSQKYSAQTDVIENLEQQKIALQAMINAESSKKKADKGKIAEWERQIQAINQAIDQMKTKIVEDVLQTSVVDAAAQVGDALVDAFGRGESAVDSLNKAANDMIKNLLQNQLNLMLQTRMQPILDDLLAATGMNADGTGSFNELTPEEIASFKAQVEAAGADMQEFLEVYSDIFGGLDANASSLEGAIKGISEETASLIAGQMNAMRIVQAQMLENSNISIAVLRNSLLQLTQIENNTRFLRLIYLEVSKNNNDGSIRANGLIG